MTRSDEQIIEIAKQAGIDMSDRKKYTDYSVTCANILLIAFARLVAEKQKEIDAGICDGLHVRGCYAWECATAIRSQK